LEIGSESPSSVKDAQAGLSGSKTKGKTESDDFKMDDAFPQSGMFLGESAPSLVEAPDNSGSFHVLIVDDDPVNRLILQGILAIHDYQVLEADSGEEALNMLSTGQEIDLIILDVMMPGISGYETCMAIREKFSIADLPIMFLTSKNSDKDLFDGYNAGGNEFIIKPVTRTNLLPKVATHARIKQAKGRGQGKLIRLNLGRRFISVGGKCC